VNTLHAYLVAVGPPGLERFAADEAGALLAAVTKPVADELQVRLAERAGRANAHQFDVHTIADIVHGAGKTAMHIRFVEAEATSAADALRWATEVADRVPLETCAP
jgi:hypothetical protein